MQIPAKTIAQVARVKFQMRTKGAEIPRRQLELADVVQEEKPENEQPAIVMNSVSRLSARVMMSGK